ncbi:type I phosphomannose isomerase catalytic subunit [Salinimicrobium gaetbulicola]|uniref:Phosphohexomutase n=2 Tax=Salinimicrobium gaetbulicola TaxID=999702 RepID=A0ABW3IAY0_9FLAO
MLNYPIKFNPILKQKIWGGDKLKTRLHKTSSKSNLGESWEISGLKGGTSVVENGVLKGRALNDLLEDYGAGLVGQKVFKEYGNEFPLLIKFIDAKSELSVQLHPGDEIARKRHDSFGKTEMWYIVEADEGAEINIGFDKSISKKEYLAHLENGKITDLLHFEKVKKGDAFFINTGKVHAIGGGVLLAEIQQPSDVTYRIFDWDRKDEHGNPRDLHTAEALEAIDFEKKDDFKLDYTREYNNPSVIKKCKYFTTNFLPITQNIIRDLSKIDSFVIYMCVEGKAAISVDGNSEEIQKGQTLLIPAKNKSIEISSEKSELLEVYIEL